MNLSDLQTFSLVAHFGTMSRAAKQLKVPKSTVSRRIQRLEDALDVELFKRSARAVTLTDHGVALHQRTASALNELLEASHAVKDRDTEPSGTLRITTTPGYGQSAEVVKCLTSFGLRYPKIFVDLELTERVVNLVEEQFDVAFRLYTHDLPGTANLMSRYLTNFRHGLFASPTYLKERGTPQHMHDFEDHRMASLSLLNLHESIWHCHGVAQEKIPTFPTPKWRTNNPISLQSFGLEGAGLVILETLQAQPLVERKQLVRVLPEYDILRGKSALVWPESRHLAPRVRAFIEHAVQSFNDSLDSLPTE